MSAYNLDTQAGMSSTVLMLDSEDATSYYMTSASGSTVTSYFSKTLVTPVVPPHGTQMLVSLHSATIPYSWYNIRPELNDTVDFYLTDADGSSNQSAAHSFVIPAGNYGATALRQALVNGIHAACGLAVGISFSPITYKLTFSHTGSNVIHLDFEGAHAHITPHKELGFHRAGQRQIKAGAPLTSDNVIDVAGSVHGLYVHTNLSSDSVINSRGVASNVISRVPITVPSGGLIFYSPSDTGSHKHLVGNAPISQVVVQLTDPRGRILDLNGLHWQLQIQFDFVLDKPRVPRPIGSLRQMSDALVVPQPQSREPRARNKSRRKAIQK